MFIVMHCGGMPFNGETIARKSLGGSESACYYVARELARAGHRVTVFTNLGHTPLSNGDGALEGEWDGVKYVSMGVTSEQAPLGDRFHTYAENTPHDVLIIQRHPLAFRFPWACKLGLWWLHDLAMGRLEGEVKSMAWNMDSIITVSEWHRQQVIDTWGVKPAFVRAIQNGVDLSLFKGEVGDRDRGTLVGTSPSESISKFYEHGQFKLLYAARPERGLVHLLKEGGIMERLVKEKPSVHLYTCTYDNAAPQLRPLYEYLAKRASQLSNVTDLGPLTKQQLADVQRQCDLYVYPTLFEDTSCIAMMECAAAGLPVLTCDIAALPETTKDGGVLRLALKDGEVNIEEMTQEIIDLANNAALYPGTGYTAKELRDKQLAIAPRFDWKNAVGMLLGHIAQLFAEKRASKGAVLRGFIRNSDIVAANGNAGGDESEFCEIGKRAWRELYDCYAFAWSSKFKEHYDTYYEYEKNRGVNYGPESLDGNMRFEHVSKLVGDYTVSGDLVVDYGCAHGHYTVNLAKRYPDRQFIGIDIAASNIEKARAWAENDGVKNARFYQGSLDDIGDWAQFGGSSDAQRQLIRAAKVLIAAEVLEHVARPVELSQHLCSMLLKTGGYAVFTTPYGPWEAVGYKQHHPWRAHLHHFERQDITDVWGAQADFKVACAPSGQTVEHESYGSYITSFKWYGNDFAPAFGNVNYEQKLLVHAPRQTVSACYIVRNAEATLLRSLDSIKDHVDEIVIAVDKTTNDGTHGVIDKFRRDCQRVLWPVVTTLEIESPLDIGFDVARNASIARASGDWVLWLDSDEIMVNGQNMAKYLRTNGYDGYGVKQHHFTVEPLGVQRTDLPCRLFRNRIGVQFRGVVHEHPEVELNKGVGHVMLIPDIDIAHEGYTTDLIREKRFERNLGLMVRDREQNPERLLGKFLWVRDLAQMCAFELRRTQRLTPVMIERATVGIALFEELLKDDRTPIEQLVEALEFYTVLVGVTNPEAVEIELEFGASRVGVRNRGGRAVTRVASHEHATLLVNRIVKERMKTYESRYF